MIVASGTNGHQQKGEDEFFVRDLAVRGSFSFQGSDKRAVLEVAAVLLLTADAPDAQGLDSKNRRNCDNYHNKHWYHC